MTKLQTSNLHASAFFNLTLRMRIGGRHNCKIKWKIEDGELTTSFVS